jgi:transposase-like protein
VAEEMGETISEAVRLGRSQHRGDSHVLPIAATASQEHEIHHLLERLNEEIKRRTLVVRIFPNTASCPRLVRALAVEMHENWIEAIRYLNMQYLKEHKKEQLTKAAA